MRLFLALFLGIWATLAGADSIDPAFPALYSVVGVDIDDTLNIRALPDAKAEIVGQLAYDAADIEVTALSREGQWARMNFGEKTGWAAARFLLRQPEVTNGLGLPLGLTCFGTEPFWTMAFLDETTLNYLTPEGETRFAILSTSPSPGFTQIAETGYRFTWQSDQAEVTAHILPGQCSDGMSDRAYGLHYIDNERPRIGCCSLR